MVFVVVIILKLRLSIVSFYFGHNKKCLCGRISEVSNEICLDVSFFTYTYVHKYIHKYINFLFAEMLFYFSDKNLFEIDF